MPIGRVNRVNMSKSKSLEVWVAEDSPFYKLIVEEAVEEIAKVTDQLILLTVFERFGDIRSAFEEAEQGHRQWPLAVLSDLHFPDNSQDDLEDLLVFYSRYTQHIPLSFMSCNFESLELAKKLTQDLIQNQSDTLLPIKFLRKDTADTMNNLIRTIHDMVFPPRVQHSRVGASLV